MNRILVAALCAAALFSGSASAAGVAKLTDIRGSVLVGTEDGFRAVSAPTKLSAGDRVVVAADGRVVLGYGRDCSVALPPNSEITITEQACVVGTQNGPFSLLEPLRPLSWGILMGIGALIGSIL